jgi:D-alanyl-D-alanine carboxypeptidase
LFTSATVCRERELEILLPVVGGTKDQVALTNVSAVTLSLLPNQKIVMSLELPIFLYAPIIENKSVIGEAVFFCDGKEVARTPLVSTESITQREIKKNFWQKLWAKFKLWFYGYE